VLRKVRWWEFSCGNCTVVTVKLNVTIDCHNTRRLLVLVPSGRRWASFSTVNIFRRCKHILQNIDDVLVQWVSFLREPFKSLIQKFIQQIQRTLFWRTSVGPGVSPPGIWTIPRVLMVIKTSLSDQYILFPMLLLLYPRGRTSLYCCAESYHLISTTDLGWKIFHSNTCAFGMVSLLPFPTNPAIPALRFLHPASHRTFWVAFVNGPTLDTR